MKKLAVLGPSGTYCDIAKDMYLSKVNTKYEIEYKQTIIKTAASVSNNCLAIVPFENMLDGFVLETLDTITNNDSLIIKQLQLPVDFAFVTKAESIKDVKSCYVQFKAAGQCLNFLSKYDFKVYKTDSNGQTLEMYKKDMNDSTIGAIIPIHSINSVEYKTIVKRIADQRGNKTRFVILKNNRLKENWYEMDRNKLVSYINKITGNKTNFNASFMITSEKDRPGVLFEILNSFHELNINMNSIMSRPLKTHMGEYKFFIEANFNNNSKETLIELLINLSKNFKTDLLGVYNTLKH